MTSRVVELFAKDGCVYLELRSTPRAVTETGMTKNQYIKAMIDGIEDAISRISTITVRVLISIDRRHTLTQSMETVDCALRFMNTGYIVGIDLCGDPSCGSFVDTMLPALTYARHKGLKGNFELKSYCSFGGNTRHFRRNDVHLEIRARPNRTLYFSG